MISMRNERGSVLVFITLMIVLLMVMVGMGLDSGHLAYIRAQGQPAVDAAALAAASAVPTGSLANVQGRAAAFNATNTFQGSTADTSYRIAPDNVTLVQYDDATGTITRTDDINAANGARVALEDSNPYAGGTANKAMKSPLFLTPLFNLMGFPTSGTQKVSVSAVAAIRAAPDLPIAIQRDICGATPPEGEPYPTNPQQKLLQSNTPDDTSGYTTFYINATSKTQVNNLLQGALTCTGAPAVGIGFCTQLNNGQIASLYDEFKNLFTADSTRCFFIPVVDNGVSFTGCSPIRDFAKFCPIAGSDGLGVGKTKSADEKGWDKYIYGDVTCGQNPYRAGEMRCQIPVLVRDRTSGM